jgi:hypothetical protein
MAASIDVAQVQNMYKEVYGDDASFVKASEEERQLQEAFPFQAGDKPGDKYVEAIRMSGEHGFTFRQSGVQRNFNPSVALRIERATFLGKILEFTSTAEIDAVARAVQGGRQAFKDTIGVKQEAMRDALIKHTEWSLLNGGRDLGVIASVAAGSSAAEKVLTITEGSWAPTFFAESENMPLDIYDSTSGVLSGTAVRRSSGTDKFTIVSFDMDARTLTVLADDSTDWAAVVAGDRLWRYSSYLNEDLGIIGITADQSGELFLEDPDRVYGMMKGVVDDEGGALTFARVKKMVARIARRSSRKAKFNVRVSPLQWYALDIEASGSRNYDSSYRKTATNGFSSIEFDSPYGLISIIGHAFMKDGEAHVSDDRVFSRRGVSDIDFTVFSQNGEKYNYTVLQERNAVQWRAFSQQGMFSKMPGRTGLFTGLEVPSITVT